MRKIKTNVSAKKAFSIILLLLLFAILVISFRTSMTRDNDLPGGDSAWSINLLLQLETYEKASSVQIPPPWDTTFTRMYAQSLAHPELQLKRTKKTDNNRDITLIAASPGIHTVNAEFNIHVSALQRSNLKKTPLSCLPDIKRQGEIRHAVSNDTGEHIFSDDPERHHQQAVCQ